MVSFSVRAGILEIKGAGPHRPEEWDAVFDSVRNDPAVSDGSPAILDIRELQVELSAIALITRIQNFRDRLGPKMGRTCAIVISPDNRFLSRSFQHYAQELIDLRVGIFSDMDEARRWLTAR